MCKVCHTGIFYGFVYGRSQSSHFMCKIEGSQTRVVGSFRLPGWIFFTVHSQQGDPLFADVGHLLLYMTDEVLGPREITN